MELIKKKKLKIHLRKKERKKKAEEKKKRTGKKKKVEDETEVHRVDKEEESAKKWRREL